MNLDLIKTKAKCFVVLIIIVCNITAKIFHNLKLIIFINNGDHNHEALCEETVTKQKVMSVLKRKTTTNLNAKPNKLIRHELKNC